MKIPYTELPPKLKQAAKTLKKMWTKLQKMPNWNGGDPDLERTLNSGLWDLSNESFNRSAKDWVLILKYWKLLTPELTDELMPYLLAGNNE